MKTGITILLLALLFSCKKGDFYSCEKCYSDTTTKPEQPVVKMDSGVLNDMDVQIGWLYYDTTGNLAGSVGQGPHMLGNIKELFVYPDFKMISADTVQTFYVEWYKQFPKRKDSDLLLRAGPFVLNEPIEFIPAGCESVKLIRFTDKNN